MVAPGVGKVAQGSGAARDCFVEQHSVRNSKLRQTFRAPNEVGLFPFANGVYVVSGISIHRN